MITSTVTGTCTMRVRIRRAKLRNLNINEKTVNPSKEMSSKAIQDANGNQDPNNVKKKKKTTKEIDITVRIPALNQVHQLKADYYGRVAQLYPTVCQLAGIEDRRWFGFQYHKGVDKTIWLLGKTRVALLRTPIGERNRQLEFAVRFYPTDLEKQTSCDDSLLDFFYRQVSSDLSTNRYNFEISSRVSTRLAALSLRLIIAH